ncbi:hypothetical protein DSCA_07840 [Desulfosarcina alkanivorans]|jgi:hypothetical protein|uniref:Uncharacterized protein n=1 Tax=Desulfosarcina alkanivorans TaxID=571177 RepID=A0A5K7YKN3_9BACT|nr:hypothetical protein [Desulfosarcina alkanivorans]BBO66854.1 hypothetical protein DSCA_07840 [Desulfosarcina alkanivorans]
MRKTTFCLLVIAVAAVCGCSGHPAGNTAGVAVLFADDPHVFDPAVLYRGTVVGRLLSRQWGNGVTRLYIAPETPYADLIATNMAIVVKAGRMHLVTLGGVGEPVPADAGICGFVNTFSYRWFKFKHLINSVTMAANRRAMRLQHRSGLAG